MKDTLLIALTIALAATFTAYYSQSETLTQTKQELATAQQALARTNAMLCATEPSEKTAKIPPLRTSLLEKMDHVTRASLLEKLYIEEMLADDTKSPTIIPISDTP